MKGRRMTGRKNRKGRGGGGEEEKEKMAVTALGMTCS